MFDLIAFDADDTLWHNETLYTATQEKLRELLSHYTSSETVDQKLYQTEMRNLQYYGYGIKSFALSMIETAIELTEGRILGHEIQQIIDNAKDMRRAGVQLLEGVEETIALLAKSYPLMIITKGDLFDQETKLARSGIADYFSIIEIVSGKTKDTYVHLLEKHHIDPARFLMVGNSLKSDILPVLELGGCGVYIPYEQTWEHEVVDAGAIEMRYHQLDQIGLLPALLDQITPKKP